MQTEAIMLLKINRDISRSAEAPGRRGSSTRGAQEAGEEERAVSGQPGHHGHRSSKAEQVSRLGSRRHCSDG